jgi:hypothetical protein
MGGIVTIPDFLQPAGGTVMMTLSDDPEYPSRRTYVVKVRSDATADALVGRLESLVDGRRHEFTSAHDLVRLIAAELREPTV